MQVISLKRGCEYVIRESTLDDAISLGNRLRWSDIQEILASSGRIPSVALKEGFLRSDLCWTAWKGDLQIAMFGVGARSAMSTQGCPWMLGSEELDHAVIGIGRFSRYYVEKMSERYNYLENFIDMRQKKSIRWLKWCGFKIEDPEPFGIHGELFHRFWR
jgi:hypothetical protein